LIRTSEAGTMHTGLQGAAADLAKVAALIICVFSAQNAFGLIENYEPTGWDFAFYTLAISTIAFTTLIVLAYRQYRWLIYSIFSLTLLVDAAAMDGVLRHLVQGGDFVLWVVPFLAHATAAITGWILVGLRTEPAYWNGIVRPVTFTLAASTSIFPLTCYFWLEKISIVVMWIPVNASFFLMMTAQILPPLSWDSEQKWQLKITRLFAVAIVLFLVVPYVLGGFLPLDLSQQQINAFFRAALFAFTLFSLIVVIGQATASIRARERAEREAAEAARKEALLQLELERSEREYQQALKEKIKSDRILSADQYPSTEFSFDIVKDIRDKTETRSVLKFKGKAYSFSIPLDTETSAEDLRVKSAFTIEGVNPKLFEDIIRFDKDAEDIHSIVINLAIRAKAEH